MSDTQPCDTPPDKKLAEELDILFAYAPIGILFAYNGVIARANPEVAHLLAYDSPQLMVGMVSSSIFVSADDYARFSQHVIPFLVRDATVNVEWQLRKTDGSTVMVSMTGRPLPASRYTRGAIWMLEDITERLRKEQELSAYRGQLEERVKERTQELQLSNEQLQTSHRQLQEAHQQLVQAEKLSALGSLVAGIAHELNTPIGNSVTVASSLHDASQQVSRQLKEGTLRKSTFARALENTVSGADILLRNLSRAAELISSFKQVAVDQTSNQRREFDLQASVDDVLVSLTPMYRKTPYLVQFTPLPGIKMNSYPGALSQVVINLLSNALAHAFEGREHGTVQIVIRDVADGFVELRVSDDGVGIPEANLNRVFDPFFTTKLGQGGSGLGMNIVYNLVTVVLGGKVSLESAVGKGTHVIVKLPLVAPVKAQH